MEEETKPTWYNSGQPIFGNFKIHIIASAIYFASAVAPLIGIACGSIQLNTLKSPFAVGWAFFVLLAYPAWSWIETWKFERWVRQFKKSQRDIERHYYNVMLSHAKAFWTAMLAAYSFAGIWGLLMKP